MGKLKTNPLSPFTYTISLKSPSDKITMQPTINEGTIISRCVTIFNLFFNPFSLRKFKLKYKKKNTMGTVDTQSVVLHNPRYVSSLTLNMSMQKVQKAALKTVKV